MKPLIIAATKSTPGIDFNPVTNVLQIQGQSYPENAFAFYEPVMDWTDAFIERLEPDSPVRIELHLPYINTSSTKCFMMLLEKFEEAHSSGKRVSILWYCNEDNESEQECAEEFKEDLTLPFEIIMKSEDV